MLHMKKENYKQIVASYTRTRDMRKALMEQLNMGKYEHGFYSSEIQNVKIAYDMLGLHEVSLNDENTMHVLIPENEKEEFSIATDDFIFLMKNAGKDEALQDCIWDTFAEQNDSRRVELQNWFV